MSQIYFISDTHFGHANVIRYSRRPFSSVEEMDEALIENWNAVVRPHDRVYHLGDFSFSRPAVVGEIVAKLNGEIHLIRGNHDAHLNKAVESMFASVRDTHILKVGAQKIFLSHYAHRVWESSHHGAWNLHGHSHGSLPRLPGYKQADMGVDCWEYKPVHFETIKTEMDKVEYIPVDHHGEKDFQP